LEQLLGHCDYGKDQLVCHDREKVIIAFSSVLVREQCRYVFKDAWLGRTRIIFL